jgi:23S rRNA pseudouridine2605 synthase
MLERLQKIIARAGIASRRHAEELIRSGQVRVNGVVVTELGTKADPEHDRIEAAGRLAERPEAVGYYLLHKPVHVVSTMSDPEGRATLRHLLRGLAGGVFPVGRLDYASSGLVLLTSDGVLADRIFKCSARMPQVYWIKLKGRPSEETLRQVRSQAHAKLRLLRSPGSAPPVADNPWYEAEVGEARRDLLRSALFEAGHPVEKTKRVKLGPLDLGDIEEAHYRSLEPGEVERLRRAVERAEKAPRPVVKGRPKRFFRKRFANLQKAPSGSVPAGKAPATKVAAGKAFPDKTLPGKFVPRKMGRRNAPPHKVTPRKVGQ